MKCIKKFESILPKVEEMIGLGYGRHSISVALGIKESQARALINYLLSGDCKAKDANVLNVITQTQKLLDKNRMRKKETRETCRQIGTLEELGKNILQLLEEKNFSKMTVKHDFDENGATGIVHISDTHFNELINLSSNKYDFNIAAKRLFLLAERAKIYFNSLGVTHILVAMTGDLMNSDRRLDEVLNAVTNRSRATFLAVDILQQFIVDLNKDFHITVAYVSGNESRVNLELGWNDNPVSDSYDTMIFYILKKAFENSDIEFLEGDCSELIVSVGKKNILLMHGHGCIKGSVEQSVEQLKGRYASESKIIDYVLFGHIHSAIIGDHFARSSSLCGSNAYNERSLNIRGRASQNLYVVHQSGLIDGFKIDLQITEGKQYKVDPSMAEYNPKSKKKSIPVQTIFQVVV